MLRNDLRDLYKTGKVFLGSRRNVGLSESLFQMEEPTTEKAPRCLSM